MLVALAAPLATCAGSVPVSTSPPVNPTLMLAPAASAATAAGPPETAAPTPPVNPSPRASTPVVPVTAGQITFGSAFDTATGAIVDPHATFRTGELATWRADLKAPVGSTGLVWVIIQPRPSGLEFEHWRQSLVIIDPTLQVIVNQLDLWLYCHGGAGTYVMRYTRSDGQVLAEGTFQSSPAPTPPTPNVSSRVHPDPSPSLPRSGSTDPDRRCRKPDLRSLVSHRA